MHSDHLAGAFRQPMPTRSLRTGHHLTELGLGASQFGNLFTETTDELSTRAVKAGLDEGIRYFDTAPHYGLGLSEHRLGHALDDTTADVLVSSKVGRLLVASPETADRSTTTGSSYLRPRGGSGTSVATGYFVPSSSHSRAWIRTGSTSPICTIRTTTGSRLRPTESQP